MFSIGYYREICISEAYNRTSRPAVRPAKTYLAWPLPVAGVEEAGVEYPSCYGGAGVEEAGVEEGHPV